MSEATRKPTLAAVKAPAQTSWKAWPWWWLASVLGLLLISSVQIWPKLDVPFILVFAFGWMGCCAISVTGHELAHFFVGRWARLQIWCLRIGGGKVVFQKDFPEFQLILAERPISGANYAYIFSEEMKETRWKLFFMVGAGPAFNAILFIFLVPSFFAVQFPDIFNGVKPVPFAPLMALANGCFLLMSLLPYRAKYNGVKLQTDGLRLLNLLFNRQPEAATLAASDGHSLYI